MVKPVIYGNGGLSGSSGAVHNRGTNIRGRSELSGHDMAADLIAPLCTWSVKMQGVLFQDLFLAAS